MRSEYVLKPSLNRLEAGNRLSASERVKESQNGERRNERKVRRNAIAIMMIFAFLALTLVSFPTVSAKTQPRLAFIGVEIIFFNYWEEPGPGPHHNDLPTGYDANGNPFWAYWKGKIIGIGITGTCYFWETPANYVEGGIEYFFEDFFIVFKDCSWIMGHDEGIWSFVTFKYRADGWVTGASSYGLGRCFVGCRFHESGKTTDLSLFNPPTNPLIGKGMCFIGP